MGFLKKLKESTMGANADDIADGIETNALIVSMEPTGMVVSHGTFPMRVCVFGLQIQPENGEPYIVSVKQQIFEPNMARIQPGATIVTAVVDANDPSHVAIDFETAPPASQPKAATHSAADILANGEPCSAVIAMFQDTGMKHPVSGDPVFALMLTVMPTNDSPYQVQVGLAVPARALPKLFPGSQVPAKRAPGTPNEVVIDWDAALA